MAHHQPFQVTGFHSCDKEIGIAVLNGKMELQPSNNAWDWLGGGIYFWEQNPDRAMEYAMESAIGKQYNKVRIKTPLVIGTTIELGNCLNLIEPESLAIIEDAYKGMEKVILDQHQALPINSGSKRELDCALIKYVHKISKLKSLPAYDTIRSAFQEGREVYPNASFTTRLHIQICVINPLMIKGYFLPRPLEQYNPYLNKAFI